MQQDAIASADRPAPAVDDQLGGISEGSVQQAADAFAGVFRQLFGGFAEPTR